MTPEEKRLAIAQRLAEMKAECIAGTEMMKDLQKLNDHILARIAELERELEALDRGGH